MIYQALKLIVSELNTYLDPVEGDQAVLGNIALYESKLEGSQLTDKVVATLVGIQEEASLKNRPPYRVNSLQQTEYKNPPVTLNLKLLFSVTTENYNNALVYLSRVIAFFQHKRSFTNQNTPVPPATPEIEGMQRFKLLLDLYSPSFEENNYLWGTLGGKQFPSALYKVRLVEIAREDALKESRGVIKNIETTGKTLE